MDIKDKVVLITGASSGIGKAISQNLALKGSKLSLISRSTDKLIELSEELSKLTQVVVFPADITDRNLVEYAVKSSVDKFGRIDIVVNCAGLGYFGPIETISMDDLDRLIKTNIFGLLNVTQLSIPYLKNSKGMLVNIPSGLSKRALPFMGAYAGTKSMVDSISDAERLELRKFGIKVLNYCPPMVDTEFFNNTIKGMDYEMSSSHMKMWKPETVAEDIVNSIVNGRREVVRGKSLQYMNFFFPKTIDNIFYKSMVLKLSK